MKFFLLDSSGKVDLNWYIAYENRCSRSGVTGQFRENPIVFLEFNKILHFYMEFSWCRVGSDMVPSWFWRGAELVVVQWAELVKVPKRLTFTYSYHYTCCLLTKLSYLPNFAHVSVTAEAKITIYYFKLWKIIFTFLLTLVNSDTESHTAESYHLILLHCCTTLLRETPSTQRFRRSMGTFREFFWI